MKKLMPTMSFVLFAAGAHLATMFGLLEYKNFQLLLAIHIFLGGFLLLGQFILSKVKTIDPAKVGMAFLAITVFKMLFSLLFVFLFFKLGEVPKFPLIGNFFSVFFLYLIFEVATALKELK